MRWETRDTLYIIQGETFSEPFTWEEDNEDPDVHTPFADLTGADIRAAYVLADGTAAVQFTTAIVDAANCIFSLSLTPTQTLALTQSGEWDVRIVLLDGTVYYPCGGDVVLQPTGTRAAP